MLCWRNSWKQCYYPYRCQMRRLRTTFLFGESFVLLRHYIFLGRPLTDLQPTAQWCLVDSGHTYMRSELSTGNLSRARPDPAKRWPDPRLPTESLTRPYPTLPHKQYYVSRVQHSSCQRGTILYNCCMISRETVIYQTAIVIVIRVYMACLFYLFNDSLNKTCQDNFKNHNKF